jgi:hypothetical protein
MLAARVALVTLLASAGALAQTPGIGETRPAPPPPGAAIERTEPRTAPAPDKAGSEADAAISRCSELTGAAHDDCVHKERAAPAGATRRPEPPSAPPPQNPR